MILDLDKAYTPVNIFSLGYWQVWLLLIAILLIVLYNGYYRENEEWSFKRPLIRTIVGIGVFSVLASIGLSCYDNYMVNKTMEKRALEEYSKYHYNMKEFVLEGENLEGIVTFQRRNENKKEKGYLQRVAENEWLLKDSKGNEIKSEFTILRDGEQKHYEDIPAMKELNELFGTELPKSEGGK